jgi:hypothetical protein
MTFGLACLIAGAGTVTLPDTRYLTMPETLDAFAASHKEMGSTGAGGEGYGEGAMSGALRRRRRVALSIEDRL